ncbi:MAG: segregation and condensation protein B [Bacteroidia bacterium]
MDFLQKHIEALIFCAPKPINLETLQNCLSEMFEAEVPEQDILDRIEQLTKKYQSDEFSFEIIEAGGGFQFMTKPAYQESIGVFLKQTSKKRLSRSALETLSIIAYRQPITKPELEQIRGVNCDYAIRKLLDKELVEIRGKSDGVGRPMLYGTALQFLEYFGINHINELPTPKDFAEEEEEI